MAENSVSFPSQKYVNIEGLTLQEIETLVILRTLDQNKWNRSKSARALGISVRTLFTKIKSMQQLAKPSDQLTQ